MAPSPLWSDLPEGPLYSICSLLSFSDHLRFSVICRNWHAIAVSRPHHAALKHPWLVIPPSPPYSTWSFLSPHESNVYHISLPSYSSLSTSVVGCSHSFLIIRNPQLGLSLFNPFTLRSFVLPHLANWQQVFKAAISSRPTTGSDCTVAVIASRAPLLSVCRVGDSEWRSVSSTYIIEDIVFHDDRLFASGQHYVTEYEIRSDLVIKACYHLPLYEQLSLYPGDLHSLYIAYSAAAKGMLVVVRNWGTMEEPGEGEWEEGEPMFLSNKTFRFLVYRLNEKTGEFMRLESLGDEVLFVGNGCTRTIMGCQGFRKNCIYYTNDHYVQPVDSMPYDFDHGWYWMERQELEPARPSPLITMPTLWLMLDA